MDFDWRLRKWRSWEILLPLSNLKWTTQRTTDTASFNLLSPVAFEENNWLGWEDWGGDLKIDWRENHERFEPLIFSLHNSQGFISSHDLSSFLLNNASSFSPYWRSWISSSRSPLRFSHCPVNLCLQFSARILL